MRICVNCAVFCHHADIRHSNTGHAVAAPNSSFLSWKMDAD